MQGSMDPMGSTDKSKELWWPQVQGFVFIQSSDFSSSSNAPDHIPKPLVLTGSQSQNFPQSNLMDMAPVGKR
jgi:hypothetical protein